MWVGPHIDTLAMFVRCGNTKEGDAFEMGDGDFFFTKPSFSQASDKRASRCWSASRDMKNAQRPPLLYTHTRTPKGLLESRMRNHDALLRIPVHPFPDVLKREQKKASEMTYLADNFENVNLLFGQDVTAD